MSQIFIIFAPGCKIMNILQVENLPQPSPGRLSRQLPAQNDDERPN